MADRENGRAGAGERGPKTAPEHVAPLSSQARFEKPFIIPCPVLLPHRGEMWTVIWVQDPLAGMSSAVPSYSEDEPPFLNESSISSGGKRIAPGWHFEAQVLHPTIQAYGFDTRTFPAASTHS